MSHRNDPEYPTKPRVDHLSESDREQALRDWKRRCKQFTDRRRKKILKDLERIANPDIAYSGVTIPRLRTMAEVSGARLRVGDTFPNRDILAIRIAEEAIQSNTNITVFRSDATQYRVVGFNFLAQANKSLHAGWVVNSIQINVPRVGLAPPVAPPVTAPGTANTKTKNVPATTLQTKWLTVLMSDVIREKPNVSNADMRTYLSAYATDQCFTDNVLQNTRTKAKLEIFGQPRDNVQYAYHLKAAMDQRGHPCELILVNRGSVMSSISQVVVEDENRRRYKDGLRTRMNAQERVPFLKEWLVRNKTYLDAQMGQGIGNKYLSGILFATSVGARVVPHLQKVIQADGCHVNFGKYTIYTAYGSDANGAMVPISFAILFGNETVVGWSRFWQFTVAQYPFLNHPEVTIITDQDKGSINAIAQHLPNACHFFCSWHRRGNVLKQCKGGKKINGGYWFFNQLLRCNTQDEINAVREEHEQNVPAHVLQYLARGVLDTSQYPGARCDMGTNIYMYGRTA